MQEVALYSSTIVSLCAMRKHLNGARTGVITGILARKHAAHDLTREAFLDPNFWIQKEPQK